MGEHKLRIGIITHNFGEDAGIFVKDFTKELSKKTHTFVFHINSETKLGNLNPLNPLSILRVRDILESASIQAVRFVRDNKIDFIIAMWALPAGLIAESIKKKLATPYCVWALGSDINTYAKIPILKNMIKNALINADLRFANSMSLSQKIKILTKMPCNFLPAATTFDPKIGHKPVNLKKNTFNFLFVGRLEKVKGTDILIDAFNILRSTYLNSHLTIIGTGSMEKSLKARVKYLRLEKNVSFLGKKNHQEVINYMFFSDCLIIPSRSESLPLVLLEAAFANLPVIATDVGDCKRLIRKYKIGFVVSENSPVALAEIMEKALTANLKLFKVGLKKLSAEFSLNKSANLILNYIQSAK